MSAAWAGGSRECFQVSPWLQAAGALRPQQHLCPQGGGGCVWGGRVWMEQARVGSKHTSRASGVRSRGWRPRFTRASSSLRGLRFLVGGARTRSRRGVLGPPPLRQRPLEGAPPCSEADTQLSVLPAPSSQHGDVTRTLPVGTRMPCPPLPRAKRRESAVPAHPGALLLQV